MACPFLVGFGTPWLAEALAATLAAISSCRSRSPKAVFMVSCRRKVLENTRAKQNLFDYWSLFYWPWILITHLRLFQLFKGGWRFGRNWEPGDWWWLVRTLDSLKEEGTADDLYQGFNAKNRLEDVGGVWGFVEWLHLLFFFHIRVKSGHRWNIYLGSGFSRLLKSRYTTRL